MHNSSLRFIPIFLLAFIPLVSNAALNKCTDANGVISYSDKPCSVEAGQKAADMKSGTALSMINVRERHRELANGCIRLTEKKQACSEYVEPQLNKAFIRSCNTPMRRKALDERQERRKNYKRQNYWERRAQRERDEYENDQDDPEIVCGNVDAEIYKFVKDNLAAEIPETEMKSIDEARYKAINVTDKPDRNSNVRFRGKDSIYTRD